MAVDLRALGFKLRRYREQLEEGLDDVSLATGIGADRLAGIEQGLIRPNGDELLILADHWTCDFQTFLSDEASEPFKDTDVLYRRHGTSFSKADRRAVREFLYLCETEQFLITELGLDKDIRNFAYSSVGTFFKQHGRDAASSLRTFLGYETDRLVVPRNVFPDFRRIGVHVFRRHLQNSNISGLFLSHIGAGACLLVNYSEDVYRQRFTAAHELAHAIFDSNQEAVVSFAHTTRVDLVEVRANVFASCYLMPPAMLAQLPPPEDWTETDALYWANRFRVSCEALAIGLKEAGRIDDATAQKIRGFRIPREAKIDPELGGDLSDTAREKKRQLLRRGLSDYYAGLCFEAHHQGLISTGKLAEALLADPGELPEFARLYGRPLRYGD
jgi:Zn-dependent peptidase ImmA (M78 family)